METPLGTRELASRLEARVSRVTVPLLLALAFAFAFFALVTAVFRPPGATVALLVIDGGGALALGGGALLLRARPQLASHANTIAGLALLFTLGASLAAIKLLHLPAQTTNVLIVDLVASTILLSPAWVAVVLVASLGGWLGVALSEGMGEAWLNAGFALVATLAMSVMIQIVRLRDARTTEQLAESNVRKANVLEAAVVREREHARSLAAANETLQAFTYVVSHDLKEPIRGMDAYLDEFEEVMEAGDAEARRENLRRVRENLEYLERLVVGLLAWSRATTTPVEPEPIDVMRFLAQPANRVQFEPALRERGARLDVDPDVPPVMGTSPLLAQALGNLILNSIRHLPAEAARVRVHDGPAEAGFVDVVVVDAGPGYPEEVLQRFARGGPGPAYARGGFGLAIARRAVERMGGRLELRNGAAGGAEAHVILPAADERRMRFEERARKLT